MSGSPFVPDTFFETLEFVASAGERGTFHLPTISAMVDAKWLTRRAGIGPGGVRGTKIAITSEGRRALELRKAVAPLPW